MECTIAAVFGDFALVATDQTHAHSILVVKVEFQQKINAGGLQDRNEYW